jgi:hypothetical protein
MASMAQSDFDLSIADQAPKPPTLTGYNAVHLVVYLRILDAEADGADWSEAARIVLRINPIREPGRARRAWESFSPALKG